MIRYATLEDVPLILSLIRELAEYEKLLHEVTATEDDLCDTLFSPAPKAEVILAFEGETVVGFALFFHNYSTFLGRPGLYIEDLYVRPSHRGKGWGKTFLRFLAQVALERKCGRMEWWCLDWNKESVDFYKRNGAIPMDDWTVYRLTQDRLEALSSSP